MFLFFFVLSEFTVGSHDAPVRCVEYAPDVNAVVSGSWDSTVRLWDPRGPTAAGTFNQPDKVSTSSWLFKFHNILFSSRWHLSTQKPALASRLIFREFPKSCHQDCANVTLFDSLSYLLLLLLR
jgi:WD40 repeat protein